LYQVCPGEPVFTFGRPIVDEASIRVQGGEFRIVVKNNSRKNKYIKEVMLNGKKLDSLFITYENIRKGGTLELVMTDKKSDALKPLK
jgi:putative alpha-1,2-mannosidase